MDTEVTVAPGATYYYLDKMYSEGETLRVFGIDAEIGKRFGVLV